MSTSPDVDRYARACTIAGALLMFAGLILLLISIQSLALRCDLRSSAIPA